MRRTAAILIALMTMGGSANALTVSPNVGPLLKEAQQMIAAKNYKGAMAKVNEADAVKVSADDETVINQFRGVIAAASSDPAQSHCTNAEMGNARCDGRATGVQP